MKLYEYQYTIKDIVLTLDQNYEIRDGSVVYMSIIHDYTNRKLPIIKLDIELQTDIIEKMYEYRSTTGRIKLTVNENQIDDEGNIVNTVATINKTFSYVTAKDQSDYITSSDSETEHAVDEMRTLQLFECYLIEMDMVNRFNKQISVMFRKASKPDILQALIEMRDIPGKIVVATPPLDYGIVDNALFPYADLIGNINTLNARYGIYNFAPTVYYDLDYLYCLNLLEPNIIMPSATDYNEIVFLMKNVTSAERFIEGSCNDRETKAHYINIRREPTITNYNERATATKFSTVTTIDKDGEVSKTTLDDEVTSMRYVYSQNSMSTDQMINTNLYGRSIEINVNNIATSFIRPYKRVTFDVDTQFENLDLRGKSFRLGGWMLSINREGTGGANAKYIHDVNITVHEQMMKE